VLVCAAQWFSEGSRGSLASRLPRGDLFGALPVSTRARVCRSPTLHSALPPSLSRSDFRNRAGGKLVHSQQEAMTPSKPCQGASSLLAPPSHLFRPFPGPVFVLPIPPCLSPPFDCFRRIGSPRALAHCPSRVGTAGSGLLRLTCGLTTHTSRSYEALFRRYEFDFMQCSRVKFTATLGREARSLARIHPPHHESLSPVDRGEGCHHRHRRHRERLAVHIGEGIGRR